MIHQTENIHEAVRLAEKLKIAGEHDWFRGQTQDWPLVSSFCRVAEKQMHEVKKKIGRFEHWIEFTSGLEPIANSTDMTIAVAQHYGLPTNFIDFTTEPSIAGFFASDGVPSSNRASCIMCLNTKDLAEFWELLKQVRGGPIPEFIRMNVPNLWRLEAQHGVFLFCPFQNFEEIYDLDRIVFPYTGPIDVPLRTLIYPSRKSQLEILLDQYFMNEELVEGTRAILATDMSIHSLPSRPGKLDRDLVPGGPPPRPASWDESAVSSWREITPELFSEHRMSECWELTTSSKDDSSITMAMISDQVKVRLSLTPGARRKLLDWRINLTDSIIRPYEAAEITHALQRLWDGIRLLPYSDEQIAEGISYCVALGVQWLNSAEVDRDDWEHICARLFFDGIQVEFGSQDGSYSRAFVSRSALFGAVRNDIGKFLNPMYHDLILGDITGLLQAIFAPDRLFEYDRLSHLFATRIAPVQVWMRNGSAVFYSPARLDSFGLP